MRVFLGALWRHVGANLGSLRVSVGDIGSCEDDFGIIVESLWVYEGPFSKKIISHTDFNDFIKLLGEVLVDLGLLWDHFWHMKVTLGPL